MRILVALSGGVDSSVIAHLLKEEKHDLVGVMMKLWMDPLAPVVQRAIPTKCCSVEHIQRARSVCASLDIPFYVLNLESEFKQFVVDPFIESYKQGGTPNPCIACNRHIKFGLLLKKAEDLGCEKIATGHYAKIQRRKSGTFHLFQAADEEKDQSYYLYGLDQHALSHILFPLGGMYKHDVYSLAKKYKIRITEFYRESQDLCFFPEKDPSAFLKRYLPNISKGDITTDDGILVGQHTGLPFYTIGQRKGLGIGGLKLPLHVQRKDVSTNTIVVAPEGKDCNRMLRAHELHWVGQRPHEKTFHCMARIHSLGEKAEGYLDLSSDEPTFIFDAPIRGVADDQAIVFYRENEVIGGATIRRLDSFSKT
jgi:tRNA-uridine 2-sulfurtransferase